MIITLYFVPMILFTSRFKPDDGAKDVSECFLVILAISNVCVSILQSLNQPSLGIVDATILRMNDRWQREDHELASLVQEY